MDDGRVAFGYGTGFVYIDPRPPNAPDETPFFGVFSNLGGSLGKVVDKGDILDGKVVLRAKWGDKDWMGTRSWSMFRSSMGPTGCTWRH